MASGIQAVLFDFGGVFTDSPFHAVTEFGADIGVEPALVTQAVFGSYEHDGEHPWHQLERGEITLEAARDAIAALGRESGMEIDIYQLFMKMAGNNAGADARQPLVDRVRRLRNEGYRTGIITNNVVEFGEGWRSLIPVEELFEFVVDSSSVGVRKPDPAIFQLAIDKLALPPEHTVFLDDYHANVIAARQMGMHAIEVTPDVNAAIAELDTLLESVQ
ncbi:MAG: HAD family hydrolase [Halioglobus sp.]